MRSGSMFIISLLFFISVRGYYDYEWITTQIQVSYRKNDILFVVEDNCTENNFEKLLRIFLKAQKEALLVLEFPLTRSHLYLSDIYNITYGNLISDSDSEIDYGVCFVILLYIIVLCLVILQLFQSKQCG